MDKVLIVVDMQNDFINGVLGTKEAMQIVPYVVEKINTYISNKDLIYFTKDTHGINYLRTQEGKNLPIIHCLKNTSGWGFPASIQSLVEKVQEEKEEKIVFEKQSFGSYKLAENLKTVLSDKQDVQIEMVGLCTDICVITNAFVLKTYMPEAEIIIDAKGCAGVSKESHENALNAMKICQMTIINSK